VERFKRLVEASGNDVEYRLSKIRAQYDSDTPDGRVNILREAVTLLATLQNTLECDIYAGKLATEFGVEKATILSQVSQQRRRQKREEEKAEIRQIQREAVAGNRDEINPQRSQKIRAALAEEALIAYLLRNPDRCAAVRAKLPPEKFSTDFNRGLYEKLTDWVSEGHNVSISSFSDAYSLDEMGRISQIIAKNGKSTNQPEAEQDYIGVILSEYEKPSIQKIAEGSDEDILKYLEDLKKKKQ
jgi:DNA primase